MSSHPSSKWVCRKKAQTCYGKRAHTFGSDIPTSKFWDHAFQAVAYPINRMPTIVLDMPSPYNTLYINLNLTTHFSKCLDVPVTHTSGPITLKILPISLRILGYSAHHKGYKCMAPDGKIYISKDVIFNEIRFQYTSLFLKSPTSSTSPTQIYVPVPLSFSPGSSQPSNTKLHPSKYNTLALTTPLQQESLTTSHNLFLHQSSVISSSTHVTPLPNTTLLHSNEEPSSNHSLSSSSYEQPPTPHLYPQKSHPMITRAKDSIVQPRLHPTLLLTELNQHPTN